MKTVQIISVLFILAATCDRMAAQINLNTTTIETNQNHSTLSDTLVNKTTAAEPALTAEQQGFTKFILSDGLILYRKEVDGIIVEYKPK